MKATVKTIVIGTLSTVTKGMVKVTGRIGNTNTSENPPKDSPVKIGQYSEKSPGDFKRFSVTQTLV